MNVSACCKRKGSFVLKQIITKLTGMFLLLCICFIFVGCRAEESSLCVNKEAVSEQELTLLDGDIDLAVRMKVLQQWAYEAKITEEPFSYENMLKELEEENQKRIKKKEAGEVVYGVTEYTPVQYYYTKMGEYERMLKDTMIQNTSEEEQKEWYQAHLDEYRQIGEIRAVVKSLQDQHVISEEEISLTSENYRSLSQQNEELAAVLMDLSEGEERNWTDVYGQEWNTVCISRREGDALSYEEVKGAVSEQYASEKLETELNERIKRSEIYQDR